MRDKYPFEIGYVITSKEMVAGAVTLPFRYLHIAYRCGDYPAFFLFPIVFMLQLGCQLGCLICDKVDGNTRKMRRNRTNNQFFTIYGDQMKMCKKCGSRNIEVRMGPSVRKTVCRDCGHGEQVTAVPYATVAPIRCPFCGCTSLSYRSVRTTKVRTCIYCKKTFFYYRGRHYILIEDMQLLPKNTRIKILESLNKSIKAKQLIY